MSAETRARAGHESHEAFTPPPPPPVWTPTSWAPSEAAQLAVEAASARKRAVHSSEARLLAAEARRARAGSYRGPA